MIRKDEKTAVIEANRLHETDTGSPEVQIAILTARIQQLTEHRTNGQTPDDQHSPVADNGPVFHGKHSLQRPGDGNEQGADTAALGQGILHVFFQEFPEQRPAHAAGHNGGGIDNGSQTVHILSLSV